MEQWASQLRFLQQDTDLRAIEDWVVGWRHIGVRCHLGEHLIHLVMVVVETRGAPDALNRGGATIPSVVPTYCGL